MYKIINKRDGAELKQDQFVRGFYCFEFGAGKTMLFDTRSEALKEAKNWFRCGMFPVTPKVIGE